MALDGCQPLERFMKKEFAGHGAGSAQKSWSFCPSSRDDGASRANARHAQPARSYEYSVSGYVNGYNPTLPAYAPTRAQMEQAQREGRDLARAPPGQTFRKPTAVWDGPAPRGDPTKPAPGTPYYQREPEEEKFDATKETKDVPITGGGRLPMVGVDSSAAALGLERGVTHVSCGSSNDVALSEAGKAIAAHGDRQSVFVSAKLRPDEHKSVDAALSAILSALGVEYLDLFSLEWPVVHKPGTTEVDSEGSLEETWAALEKCVADGRVKALGVANFSVPAVERLMKCCKVKPAVNEVELHPLLAQRKLVGVCRRYGVTVLAHTSLANGDEQLLEHAKLVQAEADERNKQSAKALLTRWSIQRGVPLVINASSAIAIDECLAARTFRLTNKQKVLLDDIEPSPKVGGVRFYKPDFEFTFDDPFLGGAWWRPGLELVPN
ncbi:putative glycerol dehydrogenase [Ostreococcus tauri]|uniref:Putative glycerol dehydrogenase n=1 Tax=Ostreococcus tauri TaxID=70448 RepID=A0A1Y5IEG0_OSTTA|nr:putative glycerol dehydrogenase [Ostreococcus tauri]